MAQFSGEAYGNHHIECGNDGNTVHVFRPFFEIKKKFGPVPKESIF